jgi:hypothetical protein
MSINKPFYRNCRGFINSPNSGYSSIAFIKDREYAISPAHYVRGFFMIQDDLKRIFEFVEPSDCNLQTYSYRIHELLIRTCIEIEANFKAILKENIYTPKDKNGKAREEDYWNINDYRRINKTHHLSSYRVMVPTWSGNNSIFQPFDAWKTNAKLPWYEAYNNSKHDRHNKFIQANFNNLLNAITGLVVVLSSQFKDVEFSSNDDIMAFNGDGYYKMALAIGGFFRIEYPKDWTEEEKYDFNWSELKKEANRFEKINYNEL